LALPLPRLDGQPLADQVSQELDPLWIQIGEDVVEDLQPPGPQVWLIEARDLLGELEANGPPIEAIGH
jgi:hypothetical protein